MDPQIRFLMEGLFDYEPMIIIDKHLRESYAKDKETINNQIKKIIKTCIIPQVNLDDVPEGKEFNYIRMALHANDIEIDDPQRYDELDKDLIKTNFYTGFVLPEIPPAGAREHFIRLYQEQYHREKERALNRVSWFDVESYAEHLWDSVQV